MPAANVTPESSPPLARVRDLPAGERVVGFYLLTRLEIKPTRTGGSYLELKLQDPSGSCEAKMWEGFERILAEAKPGDAVKVDAEVNHYQGTRSLVIGRIRRATMEEVPDARALLPRARLSREAAVAQLGQVIGSISNEHLRALLRLVFEDPEFLDKYLAAPAGKKWHHAALGGLAEHTITLSRVADCICQFYPHLNHDLLLAGALLHDVGKVFELAADHTLDYTVDGRLMGHIYLGAAFVEDCMDRLPDFPLEIRRQVLHMILAHQGDGAMGSPVKPMTLESLVVHYLDELDSKLEAFQRVRAATPEGQSFSEYVKLMDRFFYLQSIDETANGSAGGTESGRA